MTCCLEKGNGPLVCSSDERIFGKFLKLTMKLLMVKALNAWTFISWNEYSSHVDGEVLILSIDN